MQRWIDYRLVQNKNKLPVSNQIIHVRQNNINENRQHILFLLKITLYLGKQGLPFRENNESRNSKNRGNFLELFNVFCEANMKERLASRYGHNTSPKYQSNLISSIAKCTRQKILNKINPLGLFTIMVDETKDKSKKEQMVIVLRFLDSDMNIYKKSIGCFHMLISNADSLSKKNIDTVLDNKLDLQNCVAQCYDSVNVMSSIHSGVQERILNVVPHAIYIHCYAHRLNLCLVHTL